MKKKSNTGILILIIIVIFFILLSIGGGLTYYFYSQTPSVNKESTAEDQDEKETINPPNNQENKNLNDNNVNDNNVNDNNVNESNDGNEPRNYKETGSVVTPYVSNITPEYASVTFNENNFVLFNPSTNQCLDTANATPTATKNLKTMGCRYNKSQVFKFDKGSVINVNSGVCISHGNRTSRYGGGVMKATACDGANLNQKYIFNPKNKILYSMTGANDCAQAKSRTNIIMSRCSIQDDKNKFIPVRVDIN